MKSGFVHNWMVLSVLGLLAGLAGCTPAIQPGPFEDFHEAATAFEARGDEALSEIQIMARKSLADESTLSDAPTLPEVILTWEEGDDAFVGSMEARPLFVDIRELREGLDALNSAFADYAGFLAKLAGGSAEDAKRIEELAKDANANLRSARDALKLDVANDELALVATIGAEALRRKIEKDRRDYLEESMDFAQPVVQAYADSGRQAMDLSAGAVKQAYLSSVDSQRATYSRGSSVERRRIVMAVLDLNERTQILLSTLAAIRDGYKQMPEAHRELRAQLDRPEAFVSAVSRLRDDVQRLRRLRDELAKAE